MAMRAGLVPIVIEALSTAVRIADSYHIVADGEEHRSGRTVRVTVVALGDLGRSPRICYHALALAEAGARVELIGYVETALDPALDRHPAIRVHPLRAPAAHASRAGFVARGAWRVARQTGELLHALLELPALARGPAWVVSPMSWTADEDVALLVDAAERYDRAMAAAPDGARALVVLVTGLGPLRDGWRSRFATLSLRRVYLRALWVEAAEYPEVVAAADLGVSVHRSTS